MWKPAAPVGATRRPAASVVSPTAAPSCRGPTCGPSTARLVRPAASAPNRRGHSPGTCLRVRCTRDEDTGSSSSSNGSSNGSSGIGGSSISTDGKFSSPNYRKKYRKLLPFEEVKRMAQGMGLRGKDDWDEWISEGKKSPWFGPYMPSYPDEVYKEEWVSWEDFLGVPLPYLQARELSRSLKLKSQEEWWAYASGGGAGGIKAAADKAAAEGRGAAAVYRAAQVAAQRLKSLEKERKHPNLPAIPHAYYKNEWTGYDDWLGIEEQTLTVPREWSEESNNDGGQT